MANAHKPSDAYLRLQVGSGSDISVRFDVALRDLDGQLTLDANDDGKLTWSEVSSREKDIQALITANLTVTRDGHSCAALNWLPLAVDSHSDGTYAVVRFTARCITQDGVIGLQYTLFARSDPTHRGIVSVQWPDGSSSRPVLTAGSMGAITLNSSGGQLDALKGFVQEGIWHIWTGFDHILFLLALLFPAVLQRTETSVWTPRSRFVPALMDVLRIVTAFTIAHSITLTAAALGFVSLPSRWVESAIAGSIMLAAINNLVPVLRENRWIAAFCFGLIHGFGFASALKDLDVSGASLGWSLFGFNVGVEVGQLAIVASFVPAAYMLRQTAFYRRGVLQGGSVLVLLLSGVWLAERALNLSLITK